VRNQDRFSRVCQVGNGIETSIRFLLRNRLHRIQICAAFGRIAIGAKLMAGSWNRRKEQPDGGRSWRIMLAIPSPPMKQWVRQSCSAS
jgi:hypothetical protein